MKPLTVCTALLGVAATLVTTSAAAAIVAAFPFTSDTNATNVASNLDSATYGSGGLFNDTVSDDGFGNVLQAYPSGTASNASGAVASNSYFTIGLTAATSQTFDLGVFDFEVGKGGSSDPRGYFVRSSVDAYSSDLISETLPSGAQQAPAATQIDFTGNAAYTGLTDLTLRFYVWAPSPGSGSFSVDFRNLVFNTPEAVPAPASVLLLIPGLVSLAALRHRRRDTPKS